ncbi:DUF2922 domain-containing protein [Thermobrachium celere]|uniref:DUF2922 domain-containing protein n=1 Tax=Thermobrachium celere DSM 8682 TaxID=941824 RepID=R7RPP0_9CLOT|nr:DUF2922 domain-containing protein [Thermobrachium celere]GFR35616.1 hypothetical protein TCEA9_14280 [Thermobrachium celere]CDF57341.1 hypothetical protein TCEL_01255 [Thermobrachium celere DSM 8682]
MAKSLIMVFQNEAGKNVSISIPNVKDEITENDVKVVMQNIIEKNIFTSTGGDLITIMSAQVVNRDVQELSVR